MTLFFTAGGVGLGVSVRAGSGFSLTESADNGTVAMSTLQVDDPSGTANLVTLTACSVVETACATQQLFNGFLTDLHVERADSLLTGAARRWDGSVSDLNYVWQQLALRSADANRPAETDVARVTWLLASTDFGAVLANHGLFDTSGPVSLSASDYRGRFPSDVMTDCAQASNKNWFAYTDATTGDTSLFYDLPSSTAYTSSLQISNVLTEVDGTTTFAPLQTGLLLERDGSRKASGIDLVWASGSTYVHNTGLGFTRDLIVSNTGIKSSSVASSTAATLLAKAVDFDRITATIQLPPASVNLVRAGQRIHVKFSHLPSYAAGAYLRVTRRTVAQAGETDALYDVTLELSNPFVLGGITTSPTTPSPPTSGSTGPATTNTNVDGSCSVVVGGAVAVGSPGAFELADFGTGAQLADSSGLGSNGCDIGATRWYGGPSSGAVYHSIAITCKGTAALVLRLTGTNTLEDRLAQGPVDDFGYYAYLWLAGVPTALDGGVLLGTFHTGAYTIDVPAYLLPASGTVYLEFSPVSRVFQGPICVDNFGTPIKDQRGLAYGYDESPAPAAHWMTLDTGQTATADWLPVEEAPTGQLATFTLMGWDGTGTPQVTVNGLPATVVSMDTSALTVTLAAPPPRNSLVLARYPVAT